jgi:hypothetical protein
MLGEQVRENGASDEQVFGEDHRAGGKVREQLRKKEEKLNQIFSLFLCCKFRI